MSLYDVITAIQNQLTPANDPRVPTGLTFEFGNVAAAHQAAPPRIVWVPEESPVDSSEKGGTGNQQPQNPTQILTRRQRITAHVWGADPDLSVPATQNERNFTAAETLADAVWYATHVVAYGSYTPVTQDCGTTDNLQRGWLFLLTFELLLPVTKPADPTAPVTTITLNLPSP